MSDIQLEVRTHEDPWSGDLKIAILEHEGRNTRIAKPVLLEMEPLPEAQRIKPTIVIPRHYAAAFMRSLTEAVDKSGMRPPAMELMRGQLEATKYHLEDLRRLLKLEAR